MPPLLVIAAAAAGAAFGARALRREWRRINAELEAAEQHSDARERDRRPTLRRDPSSGEWRPR